MRSETKGGKPRNPSLMKDMESTSKKGKRKSRKSDTASAKKAKVEEGVDLDDEARDNNSLVLPAIFEEENVDHEDHVPEEWKVEDLKTLVEAVHKSLPRSDKSNYKTTLNKVKWDKIQVGEHTTDECEKKFKEIVERVRKYRTLGEICDDAMEWTKKPWTTFKKKNRHPDLPKKPLTAYFRFYTKQLPLMRDKNPSVSIQNLATEISQKYKKLSDKKKQKYINEYEREMEEWRHKMNQFRVDHPGEAVTSERDKYEGPEKPKTPFNFYKLKRMKKFDEHELTKKEIIETIRKEWNDLATKKKCKFIEKSLKDEKRYKEEAEEYKKHHPNFVIITKSTVSKAELELLKTRDGKPEKPPASGYGMFSKIMLREVQGCPSKEKMSLIAQRWKALSDAERADYNFKAAKQTAKYVEKYQKYLNGLSEEEREKEICDTKMKLPSDKKLMSSLKSEVSEADSSTRHVESDDDNDSDESD